MSVTHDLGIWLNSSQQCFDLFGARRSRRKTPRRLARFVDEKIRWPRFDAIALDRLPRVNRDWKRKRSFFEERRDTFSTLLGMDSNHDQPTVLVLLVKSFNLRQILDAGRAPGSPEID